MQVDRRKLVTAIGGCALIGRAPRAEAAWPWFVAFSAGVAASYLVEMLKNFSLIPGAQAAVPTEVEKLVQRQDLELRASGFSTHRLYLGTCAVGSLGLTTGAVHQTEEFRALQAVGSKSKFGSFIYHKEDVIPLTILSIALKQLGVGPTLIEAIELPLNDGGGERGSGFLTRDRVYVRAASTLSGNLEWRVIENGGTPKFSIVISGTYLDGELHAQEIAPHQWRHQWTRFELKSPQLSATNNGAHKLWWPWQDAPRRRPPR
jgi:hypothetical protein